MIPPHVGRGFQPRLHAGLKGPRFPPQGSVSGFRQGEGAAGPTRGHVAIGAPRNSRPSNGVLRERLADSAAQYVQEWSKEKIVRSAGSPAAKEPEIGRNRVVAVGAATDNGATNGKAAPTRQ